MIELCLVRERERERREEAKGITDEKRKVGLKSVGSTYRKTMLAWTPSLQACVSVYIYIDIDIYGCIYHIE